MLKTILQTFLGIVLSLGGIVAIYFFISGLDSGFNFLFLALFLLLISGGVFFFIKAGKSDTTINGGFQSAATNAETTKQKQFSDRLAANNAMLNDWKKTNDTKERLKMLEISGRAENE